MLGEYADIHLVPIPNRVLKARISNIVPIIDPNIRTAKVRLEVENPGIMRLGMFVTATFHGETQERHAAVPADRDPAPARPRMGLCALGRRAFRRVEVVAGRHAARQHAGDRPRHQARRPGCGERACLPKHSGAVE